MLMIPQFIEKDLPRAFFSHCDCEAVIFDIAWGELRGVQCSWLCYRFSVCKSLETTMHLPTRPVVLNLNVKCRLLTCFRREFCSTRIEDKRVLSVPIIDGILKLIYERFPALVRTSFDDSPTECGEARLLFTGLETVCNYFCLKLYDWKLWLLINSRFHHKFVLFNKEYRFKLLNFKPFSLLSL
jgi:hypothetical protein